MTTPDNKRPIQRYLDAWGRGDTDALKSMLCADAVTHNLGGKLKEDGVAFEVSACAMWHTSFSDTTLEVRKLIAEGDEVTAYWTMTATYSGAFMGLDPTNKTVTVDELEINRVVDGKIVEIWRLSDAMGLMQQLGGF